MVVSLAIACSDIVRCALKTCIGLQRLRTESHCAPHTNKMCLQQTSKTRTIYEKVYIEFYQMSIQVPIDQMVLRPGKKPLYRCIYPSFDGSVRLRSVDYGPL